jgi:NADH-quinone oxidoreductase subunit M
MILLAGGLISWIAGKWSRVLPRIIALISLAADLILLLLIFRNHTGGVGTGEWMIAYRTEWIPTFGISLHLAADGLSMLLLMITFIVGLLSVFISWKEIRENTGFYHFNILWILSGITGVFLSMDLFLFYFFWELMLIPMYFLISIWGHENRIYASYKFFNSYPS